MIKNNKRNIIQNKEVIPDTHAFVYRNKEYPFKIDYFKYASNYFSRNFQELENTNKILLLNKDIEYNKEKKENKEIKEETIKEFINFVQSKKIELSKENVFELNYLSNEYEVSTLKEKTYEYIEEHQEELIIEFLLLDENINVNEDENILSNIKFDKSRYEDIISTNFNRYINDDRLLNFSISRLYRIISKYEENKNDEDEQEEMKNKINDFLIKEGPRFNWW